MKPVAAARKKDTSSSSEESDSDDEPAKTPATGELKHEFTFSITTPVYYSRYNCSLKVSYMFKVICGLQGPSLWQGLLSRCPLQHLQLRRSRRAAAVRTARVNLRTRLQLRYLNMLTYNIIMHQNSETPPQIFVNSGLMALF